MISMVAFATTTDSTFNSSPRARGQHRTATSRPSPCFNSSTQANLRTATYDKCVLLVSCSKDPVGYYGAMSMYEYSNGRVLLYVDPVGLFPVLVGIPQEGGGPGPVLPATPVPQQPPADAPDNDCANSNATETVVRVCIRPIRSPANPGDRLGHVYLRVSCGPNSATKEWGWSGGPLNPSDECKGKCGDKKQLRVEFRRFLRVNNNPQDEDDSPGSEDYPLEGETHHRNTYTIRRIPQDVIKCLKSVATSNSGCCIPYHATATGEGCNSNCVAFWMASTCFGSGVELPTGDGMIAPGWGKEMPKCVREAIEKAGADAKNPGNVIK